MAKEFDLKKDHKSSEASPENDHEPLFPTETGELPWTDETCHVLAGR